MSRVKSPAKSLTDAFVDAIGKKYPTTMMNWDTKMNGKFVPWGYVTQALACLDRNDINGARALLMRPLTNGLIGGPDVTAIVGYAPGASVAPGTYLAAEIKAGADRQRDSQIAAERNIKRHGGIYILVESVEQGLDDLEKYAGPGENL